MRPPRPHGTTATRPVRLPGLRRSGRWSVAPRLLLLAALAACAEDPFDRPGTWRPAGVNETNLRAMVADPAHLARGVGAGTERGQAGSRPVTQLEAGRRPALPTTRLTGIGQTTGGTGGDGGGMGGAR